MDTGKDQRIAFWRIRESIDEDDTDQHRDNDKDVLPVYFAWVIVVAFLFPLIFAFK